MTCVAIGQREKCFSHLGECAVVCLLGLPTALEYLRTNGPVWFSLQVQFRFRAHDRVEYPRDMVVYEEDDGFVAETMANAIDVPRYHVDGRVRSEVRN